MVRRVSSVNSDNGDDSLRDLCGTRLAACDVDKLALHLDQTEPGVVLTGQLVIARSFRFPAARRPVTTSHLSEKVY